MTNMRNLTKWLLVTLTAATVVTGCDSFDDAVGGSPAVISVGFSLDGAPFDGTGSGSTWTIPTVGSVCDDASATVGSQGFFFVKFNKLLDGFSIQTDPTNCTPVAALNLVITPAAPAGSSWYACYNPQSPSPDEGASVVIYQAPTATLTIPPSGGWIDATPIPGSGTAVTVVHATGTIHDKGGAAASFDVTANIVPDPGLAGDPTFGATTATSVVVNWTAPGCNAAAEYVVERAPNVPGATPAEDAPGTFAQVGAANVVGTTVTDNTGLTAATKYWYHVTAVTVVGTTNHAGTTSGDVAVTTAP